MKNQIIADGLYKMGIAAGEANMRDLISYADMLFIYDKYYKFCKRYQLVQKVFLVS